MAGLIVAETVVSERVERLVLPLRDAFAAVFFFWFGLTVSPEGLAAVALPVLAAVLLSLTLNPLAGVITARIGRLGRVAATNIGTTVLARGEFSIILATLGPRPDSTSASVPSSRSTCSSWRSPAQSSRPARGGSPASCPGAGSPPGDIARPCRGWRREPAMAHGAVAGPGVVTPGRPGSGACDVVMCA
jgi:hypothetical protein